MTRAEFFSLCSVLLFSVSVCITAATFYWNRLHSRRESAARMHAYWRSQEMNAVRSLVFDAIRDDRNGGTRLKELIAYFVSDGRLDDPADRPAWSTLIGFFCDLEIGMSCGLVDEGVAYRFFGDSHFRHYWPALKKIIDAEREQREVAIDQQWMVDLESLATRFRKLAKRR
jgi:hypothetical protein